MIKGRTTRTLLDLSCMKLLRFWRVCARRKTSKIGGSAYYTQKLHNRRFCVHRKNSKIGGSAKRSLKNISNNYLILQNRSFYVLYAKTPKSEVLRPKSEFLRTIRKNSKIGGFAPTAKTPKSEFLRSFENISNNF